MTAVRRAGVLGSPIGHSLSPVLHRAAYAALSLPWDYDAYEVAEDDLGRFLSTLDDTWVGLSLTMPLKTRILEFLDEVSERGRAVAAVNTVILDEGRLVGHNTDIPGMIAAIDERWNPDVPGFREIRRVAIIGAGATARSALAAVMERFGPDVEQVDILARHPDRARDLLDLGDRLSAPTRMGDWERRAEAWRADLVVTTLPGEVGIEPVPPQHPGLVMDVAYAPWPTPVCRTWRAAGGVVATGADLLLWQAVGQVGLMTGCEPPVERMRAALDAALQTAAT